MNEKTIFGVVGGIVVLALGIFIFGQMNAAARWEKIDKDLRRSPAKDIPKLVKRTDPAPRAWATSAESISLWTNNVLPTPALLDSLDALREAIAAEAGIVRERVGKASNEKLDTWFENMDLGVRQDVFKAGLNTAITKMASDYRMVLSKPAILKEETFSSDLSSLERGEPLLPAELQFSMKRFWLVETFLKAALEAEAFSVVSLRNFGQREQPDLEVDAKYVNELPFRADLEITFANLPRLMAGLMNSELFFRIDKLKVDKAPLRQEHLTRAGPPLASNLDLINQKALKLSAYYLMFEIDTPAKDKATSDDDLFLELPCLVTIEGVVLDCKKGEQ